MQNEYLKTLWMLRFEKIKNAEEEAAWVYQEMLDRLLPKLGQDSFVVQSLATLVHEERVHEKLAEELIQICHRNHPEIGLL